MIYSKMSRTLSFHFCLTHMLYSLILTNAFYMINSRTGALFYIAPHPEAVSVVVAAPVPADGLVAQVALPAGIALAGVRVAVACCRGKQLKGNSAKRSPLCQCWYTDLHRLADHHLL